MQTDSKPTLLGRRVMEMLPEFNGSISLFADEAGVTAEVARRVVRGENVWAKNLRKIKLTIDRLSESAARAVTAPALPDSDTTEEKVEEVPVSTKFTNPVLVDCRPVRVPEHLMPAAEEDISLPPLGRTMDETLAEIERRGIELHEREGKVVTRDRKMEMTPDLRYDIWRHETKIASHLRAKRNAEKASPVPAPEPEATEETDDWKECTRCGFVKPLDEFGSNGNRTKDGKAQHCLQCAREYYAEANRKRAEGLLYCSRCHSWKDNGEFILPAGPRKRGNADYVCTACRKYVSIDGLEASLPTPVFTEAGKTISTTEAAKILGVSTRTVTRYARNGHIPFIREDGRGSRKCTYRFYESAIKQLAGLGDIPKEKLYRVNPDEVPDEWSEPVYTTTETARMAGVSGRTARKWGYRGYLTPIYVKNNKNPLGGTLMGYAKSEVDAVLAEAKRRGVSVPMLFMDRGETVIAAPPDPKTPPSPETFQMEEFGRLMMEAIDAVASTPGPTTPGSLREVAPESTASPIRFPTPEQEVEVEFSESPVDTSVKIVKRRSFTSQEAERFLESALEVTATLESHQLRINELEQVNQALADENAELKAKIATGENAISEIDVATDTLVSKMDELEAQIRSIGEMRGDPCYVFSNNGPKIPS